MLQAVRAITTRRCRRWCSSGPGRPAPKQNRDENPPGVPEPYTVPEGYVPPTLSELFKYDTAVCTVVTNSHTLVVDRYASQQHPYSRYGYSAAILVGLAGWWYASTTTNKPAQPQH